MEYLGTFLGGVFNTSTGEFLPFELEAEPGGETINFRRIGLLRLELEVELAESVDSWEVWEQ